MLIRPNFKILTQEQAESYLKRLVGEVKQRVEDKKEATYYKKRLDEIRMYANTHGGTDIDAVIKLTQINIGDKESDDLKEIEPGVYVGSWINIEHEFDYDARISFENIKDPKFIGKSGYTCYPSEFNHMIPFDYGVCDSPEQLLNYKFTPGDYGRYILNKCGIEITPELDTELDTEITLGDYLRNSDRKFAVGFNPIKQNPENPGGGWRWHKWGHYIGKHDVQCEYLDDEDLSDINQDFILCFHIYEFKDIEPKGK